MKKLLVIITYFLFFSCNNAVEQNIVSNLDKACGCKEPSEELPWLKNLIEKAKNDKTGNYLGYIWLENYKGQDIFVTNMMLGSGGIMNWFLDCSGNHFIFHKEVENCPACNFIGNHHVYIEDEDFQFFISNMKYDVIIYSPF